MPIKLLQNRYWNPFTGNLPERVAGNMIGQFLSSFNFVGDESKLHIDKTNMRLDALLNFKFII